MGNKNKMKILSTLLALVLADNAEDGWGNPPKPGLCPENIPDQPNFDRERYVGQWFNYTANDIINVPENADCVGAKYEKLNDRQISINNTAVIQVGIRDREFPILSWAYGSGTQLEEDYPNRIYVHFTEFGGCGYLAFFCGGFVPEKSYDNYALVINCNNVVVDEVDMHVEVIYLLTRSRTWGPENPVKVQELLSIPANLGLTIDDLYETKQTGCEQYDLP